MQDPMSPLAFGLLLGLAVLLVDLVVTSVICRALERHLLAEGEDVEVLTGVDWLGAFQTFAVTALCGCLLRVWLG